MGTKVYVGNLPFKLDDSALKEAFAAVGEVTDVAIITDRASGRSKGFGFVTFADEASMQKAVQEMNGKELQGRELKVSEAREQQ